MNWLARLRPCFTRQRRGKRLNLQAARIPAKAGGYRVAKFTNSLVRDSSVGSEGEDLWIPARGLDAIFQAI